MSDTATLHKETDLTDQQIIELSQKWREEDASQQKPLVGQRETLESLLSEYADGTPIFGRKLRYMQSQHWSQMRRLRGDGEQPTLQASYTELIAHMQATASTGEQPS